MVFLFNFCNIYTDFAHRLYYYFSNYFDYLYTVMLAPLLIAGLLSISSNSYAHKIGLVGSTFIFWLSLLMLGDYYFMEAEFLVKDFEYDIFTVYKALTKPFVFNCEFFVDSISLMFLLLSSLIFFLTTFVACETYYEELSSVKYLYILLFIMQGFINLAFFSLSIFFFYAFFEAVLVPMYLIIIIWGTRSRKIKAAYLFFMYTVFFSFFFLYAIIILYSSVDEVFWYFDLVYDDYTFVFKDYYQENFLWLCFFLAFAVKVPIFPLHLWLPEAHVEAPTFGSILLASLLLKLGGYGLLRFVIPMFPNATLYFRPLVLAMCLIGAIYTGLVAIVQVDLKKIIAYSSVSHMNFAVLGLFTLNIDGVLGGLTLLLAHGFTSAALFFLVGVIYRRCHTRLIRYYMGLNVFFPMWSAFFLFFFFSNIGFPGTLNFIAEFLIFFGLIKSVYSYVVFIILIFMFLASLGYSIWTYNKIMYGEVYSGFIGGVVDLTWIEFKVLFLLSFFTIYFGIFSTGYLLDLLVFDVNLLLYPYK